MIVLYDHPERPDSAAVAWCDQCLGTRVLLAPADVVAAREFAATHRCRPISDQALFWSEP